MKESLLTLTLAFATITDSAKKASSLNRQSSLCSLAGIPAKGTSKRWYSWALAFSFFLGLMAVPLSAQGQTFSVVYSFAREGAGDRPDSLMRDAKGNLYGTTLYGGSAGVGAVFKLDTNGTETVLHSFKGHDGNGPEGVLVEDAAGNFYGTTSYGGTDSAACPDGCGTVFKLDRSGNETVLHRFGGKGDGTFPKAGVIRDAAGNLYGTTYFGGVVTLCGVGCGTIYKLDASGKETVLYRFRGGADGANPWGGLIRDEAGNLYGITEVGGVGKDSSGTVFKLGATGEFTVLHTLNFNEGCYADGTLIRDAAGNLYGTTSGCGEFGGGTVFKVAPSGETTVLYNFSSGSDGGGVYGPVVQDKAGNIYGSTGFGGDLNPGLCTEINNTPGCGVVFKIDTSDQYSVLHTFDGTDGQWAYYGVILDAAGNLYGTTAEGGSSKCYCGVVFKIEP